MGLGVALLGGAAVSSADTGAAGSDTGTSASSDSPSSSDDDRGKAGSAAPSAGDRDDDPADDTSGDEATADDEAAADDLGTEPDSTTPGDDTATTDEPVVTDDADETTQPSATDSDGTDVSGPATTPEPAIEPEPSTEPSTTPAADEPEATVETGGSTPRAGPVSLATDDRSSARFDAATTAEPSGSWWDDLVREIQYTFFNKAPTLSPTDAIETEPGVITGQLNGKSNNGFGLTYSIKTGPDHGTLTIDQEAGTYTYTYDPETFTDETKDSFVIVADNGTEARKTGLVGLVQLVMHNVAIGLGLAQRDTTESNFSVTGKKIEEPEEKIEVKIRGTGFYGDLSNKKYWAEQNFADNCLLMSILMIEGQFNGQVPTRAAEDAIVQQAKTTPSVVDPSKMMYIGGDNEDGILFEDATALLGIRGNTAALVHFPIDGDSTYDDGLDGLDAVSKLLLEGNGVIATVNNQTIWDATEDEGSPGADRTNVNHGVVVIAIDTHNGRVYINDPGVSGGKGLAVPLGAFMWAWESENFQTILVEKPVAQSQAAPQSGELVLAA